MPYMYLLICLFSGTVLSAGGVASDADRVYIHITGITSEEFTQKVPYFKETVATYLSVYCQQAADNCQIDDNHIIWRQVDISSLKDHGDYLEVELHILDREMGSAPGLTSEELKLGLRTFQSKLSAGLGSEVEVTVMEGPLIWWQIVLIGVGSVLALLLIVLLIIAVAHNRRKSQFMDAERLSRKRISILSGWRMSVHRGGCHRPSITDPYNPARTPSSPRRHSDVIDQYIYGHLTDHMVSDVTQNLQENRAISPFTWSETEVGLGNDIEIIPFRNDGVPIPVEGVLSNHPCCACRSKKGEGMNETISPIATNKALRTPGEEREIVLSRKSDRPKMKEQNSLVSEPVDGGVRDTVNVDLKGRVHCEDVTEDHTCHSLVQNKENTQGDNTHHLQACQYPKQQQHREGMITDNGDCEPSSVAAEVHGGDSIVHSDQAPLSRDHDRENTSKNRLNSPLKVATFNFTNPLFTCSEFASPL